MRQFKINPRSNSKQPKKGTLARKLLGIGTSQGVKKARLLRSGLWDESANKSRVVVYRVGEEPK